MKRYIVIYSQKVRKSNLNRCLKTKARLGGIEMVKIVKVLSEGKKRTPVQDAERIKRSIADLDYRLESTGNMTTEIWNCLYDATKQIERAAELLGACSSEMD